MLHFGAGPIAEIFPPSIKRTPSTISGLEIGRILAPTKACALSCETDALPKLKKTSSEVTAHFGIQPPLNEHEILV